MVSQLRPTIPVYIEQPNGKRAPSTGALARHLRDSADRLSESDRATAMPMVRAAWRLTRCAAAGKSRTGWRCGAPYCPRCSRRRAINYRRRLERRMRRRSRSGVAPHGLALLTLSIAAADPVQGYRRLTAARAQLFRHRLPRAFFTGGEGHIHVDPAATDEADVWNAHLHAIVSLRVPFASLDTDALRAQWASVLARIGSRGSLDLRRQQNLTAEHLSGAK
jgi:hypothetical protein